ncbi:hypothetical protein GCM10023165_16670 [Variovorax defluvii]|uniref:Uncharacterized protein n=1 Tax=Variovorax defluvii TaxID=913761 RepID=A0ABP8HE99_9BURK
MLHGFDKHPADRLLDRAQWMALPARAPLPMLESALGKDAERTPHWLRAPETGLTMVQGRAGGTGERFNLGVVTVTRCALRLGGAPRGEAAIGVAYVLGRSSLPRSTDSRRAPTPRRSGRPPAWWTCPRSPTARTRKAGPCAAPASARRRAT